MWTCKKCGQPLGLAGFVHECCKQCRADALQTKLWEKSQQCQQLVRSLGGRRIELKLVRRDIVFLEGSKQSPWVGDLFFTREAVIFVGLSQWLGWGHPREAARRRDSLLGFLETIDDDFDEFFYARKRAGKIRATTPNDVTTMLEQGEPIAIFRNQITAIIDLGENVLQIQHAGGETVDVYIGVTGLGATDFLPQALREWLNGSPITLERMSEVQTAMTVVNDQGKKRCPKCGVWDVDRAYIEDGSMGDWCPHCQQSLQSMS